MAAVCRALAADLGDGWPRWESDAAWLESQARLLACDTSTARKTPALHPTPATAPEPPARKKTRLPPVAPPRRPYARPWLQKGASALVSGEETEACKATVAQGDAAKRAGELPRAVLQMPRAPAAMAMRLAACGTQEDMRAGLPRGYPLASFILGG